MCLSVCLSTVMTWPALLSSVASILSAVSLHPLVHHTIISCVSAATVCLEKKIFFQTLNNYNTNHLWSNLSPAFLLSTVTVWTIHLTHHPFCHGHSSLMLFSFSFSQRGGSTGLGTPWHHGRCQWGRQVLVQVLAVSLRCCIVLCSGWCYYVFHHLVSVEFIFPWRYLCWKDISII